MFTTPYLSIHKLYSICQEIKDTKIWFNNLELYNTHTVNDGNLNDSFKQHH